MLAKKYDDNKLKHKCDNEYNKTVSKPWTKMLYGVNSDIMMT